MKEIVSTKMTIHRCSDDIEIDVDGYVHHYTETSYGEDADGNRGVERTFVEDVTDISAYTDNGDEFDLKDDEKDLAAEILAMNFLEG